MANRIEFGNIIFNEGLNTWVFCRRIRSLSLLHLDSVKTFGEIFCLIFNIASGGELKVIYILILLYDKEYGKSLEWDWEGFSQAQNNSVLTQESSKRRESVKLQRKITRKVYVSHN